MERFEERGASNCKNAQIYAISWEQAINMDMMSLSDSSSKENGRSKTPRVCATAAAAALCALADTSGNNNNNNVAAAEGEEEEEEEQEEEEDLPRRASRKKTAFRF